MTIHPKNVDFLIDAKSIEGEQDGTFTGYGSVFGNIDRDGDIVVAGAFRESLKQRMPAMLWQHNVKEPIGRWLEVIEDEKGVRVKGKLTLVGKGLEVYQLMKEGAVRGLSIGFVTQEAGRTPSGVREITKAKLMEISVVTFPANELATIEDVKAATSFQNLPLADRSRPWNASAAKKRVRDWSESSDGPTEDYRKAFFWYDAADRDNFGAYKLPFADIVGGKLTAIPRAVFAAAAAVQGARGGVDIPDADRAGVVRHINFYYEKMDMESPFQKGFGIDEIKAAVPNDLRAMIQNGTNFTRAGADFLVAGEVSRRKDAESSDQKASDNMIEMGKALSSVIKTVRSKTDA